MQPTKKTKTGKTSAAGTSSKTAGSGTTPGPRGGGSTTNKNTKESF